MNEKDLASAEKTAQIGDLGSRGQIWGDFAKQLFVKHFSEDESLNIAKEPILDALDECFKAGFAMGGKIVWEKTKSQLETFGTQQMNISDNIINSSKKEIELAALWPFEELPDSDSQWVDFFVKNNMDSIENIHRTLDNNQRKNIEIVLKISLSRGSDLAKRVATDKIISAIKPLVNESELNIFTMMLEMFRLILEPRFKWY